MLFNLPDTLILNLVASLISIVSNSIARSISELRCLVFSSVEPKMIILFILWNRKSFFITSRDSWISSLIIAPCLSWKSGEYFDISLINSSFLRMSLDSLFFSDCVRFSPCNCFSIILSSLFPNIFLAFSSFFSKPPQCSW